MDDLALIESESRSMLDRAREMTVNCDEDYTSVGSFVMGCKSLIAKIKAEFAEPKRKADEAHKSITAMEKRTLEPVTDAMNVASQVALEYKRTQDRLAQEEAAVVERERRREIEEARLKEAERLEAEGKKEEAEQVIAAPIQTPRPTPFQTSVPKVAGLSARTTWKARIVNSRLVKREFCTPDQVRINIHVDGFFPRGMQSEKKILSDEQRKILEDEIGGVVIELVETFAGRVRA